MSETITINGLVFHVQHNKRKTVTIAIERDDRVVIHAPLNATHERLAQIAQRRARWVHSKRQIKREHYQRSKPKEFVSGEGFYYFGKSYRLRLIEPPGSTRTPSLRLHGMWFELRANVREHAATHFARWYAEHGQEWIESRAAIFAKRIGTKPTAIHIRNLGNRWASCGRRGNLNFHWRVVCLPPSIIEYIVAHELVHLIARHHGKEFWRLLERAMPDYAQRKKWLAENGDRYF